MILDYGKKRYDKLIKIEQVKKVSAKVEKVIRKKPRLYSFFHNAGKISLIERKK